MLALQKYDLEVMFYLWGVLKSDGLQTRDACLEPSWPPPRRARVVAAALEMNVASL